MAKVIRGSRTRINNVRRQGYPRFNSVNRWNEIRSRGWERLTAVRICECIQGAGRMTLVVGGSAGKGNATWSFHQTPLTAAIPKA